MGNVADAESVDEIGKQLAAMQGIRESLAPLAGDRNAVEAVLVWAGHAYGVGTRERGTGRVRQAVSAASSGAAVEFGDLADLFAAAAPSSEAERVLVTTYWFQKLNGQATIDGQQVNTALKNLGYGVGNITNVFSGLMGRKPALAMQVQKSGTSKQARKKYKLTNAGVKRVEGLLEGEHGAEE